MAVMIESVATEMTFPGEAVAVMIEPVATVMTSPGEAVVKVEHRVPVSPKLETPVTKGMSL